MRSCFPHLILQGRHRHAAVAFRVSNTPKCYRFSAFSAKSERHEINILFSLKLNLGALFKHWNRAELLKTTALLLGRNDVIIKSFWF